MTVSAYSLEQVEAICARYGLRGEPVLLPTMGMVNEVWIAGDHVLRISLDEEAEDNAALEARIVPIAVDAGVLTPKLVAFDDSKALVDRTFTIYERERGVTLGTLEAKPGPWIEQLAHQIAKMHRSKVPTGEKPQQVSTRSDVEASIAKSVDYGRLTPSDASLLLNWTERVAPAFEAPFTTRFIHNDFHPWNLLADPSTYELTAILDWGDAGCGDPALDLGGMPAWAMIPLVHHYRELALVEDDYLEGRILCEWLCIALWEMRELSEVDYRRDWWRWQPTDVRGLITGFAEGGHRWLQWLPG